MSGNAANDQKREWITYRRFSEFNDLDITIKKRYPDLHKQLHLPHKSLINNTSPDVRIKRQKELNDYLAVNRQFSNEQRKLCNLQILIKSKMLQSHPQLGELLLKFLRNQQMET